MFDGFSSFVDSVAAEANKMAEEANKVASGLSLDNLRKDEDQDAPRATDPEATVPVQSKPGRKAEGRTVKPDKGTSVQQQQGQDEEALNRFKARLDEALAKITGLESEKSAAKSEVAKATKSVDELRAQTANLEQMHQAAQATVKQLNADVARLAAECAESKKNLASMTTANKVSKASAEKAERELSKARAELERLEGCLDASSGGIDEAAAASLAAAASALSDAQAERDALEATVEALTTERDALQDERELQQAALDKTDGALREAVQTAVARAEEWETERKQLADSQAAAEAGRVSVEKQLSASKENVQVLTGKVRDLMAKVKDFKAKVAAADKREREEAEFGAQATEKAQRVLQAKESELVAMRLKLDASSKSASDSRHESLQMSEKLTELQRDVATSDAALSESRAELQAAEEHAGKLSRELVEVRESMTQVEHSLAKERSSREEDAAKHMAALAEGERAREELQEQLAARAMEGEKSAAAHASQKEAQRAALRDEVESMRAAAQVAKARVGELEKQKSCLENTLQEGTEALEAYKKKAQEALRRATENSTRMASQAERLQEESRVSDERAAAAEHVAQAAQEKLEEARAAHASVEEKLTHATAALDVAHAEVAKLTHDAEEAAARHGEEVVALQQEVQDYQAALQLAKSSALRSPTGKSVRMGEVAGHPSMSEGVSAVAAAAVNTVELLPKPLPTPQTADDRCATVTDGAPSLSPSSSSPSSGAVISTSLPGSAPAPTSSQPLAAALATHEGVEVRYEISSSRNVFFKELQEQLKEAQLELGRRDNEVNALMDTLSRSRDETRQLQEKMDELRAYMDRNKQSRASEAEMHVSNEYLKNVVFHFMSATQRADKMRLMPVIGTILKFTEKELRSIAAAVDTADAPIVPPILGSLQNFLG